MKRLHNTVCVPTQDSTNKLHLKHTHTHTLSVFSAALAHSYHAHLHRQLRSNRAERARDKRREVQLWSCSAALLRSSPPGLCHPLELQALSLRFRPGPCHPKTEAVIELDVVQQQGETVFSRLLPLLLLLGGAERLQKVSRGRGAATVRLRAPAGVGSELLLLTTSQRPGLSQSRTAPHTASFFRGGGDVSADVASQLHQLCACPSQLP